ncbi:hypothetical protein BK816_05530 [Boudabousia tangfeifanii]|uniref:Metal-binding protein n=1 Tax=Boudabousia tangfeifanii TaxID=1912795 RepID=A0A1D9MKE3_9ACTO|nr:YceD family protein [Boudabousia tangfeifanii]AOZ72821.1 hypothetical protein BK816_05530 [Boudabousia tangfeifanii]
MHFTDDYLLSVRDLPRQPGSFDELYAQVTLPWENDLVKLSDPEPELHFMAQSVSDGVLLTINGELAWEGSCARCLQPAEGDFDLSATELFFYPEAAKAAEANTKDVDIDPLPTVVDDQIDIEAILRDEIMLALPMLPLCDEDCEGLCATCGEAWADLPADHVHAEVDPRLAVLGQLLANQENEQSGESPA